MKLAAIVVLAACSAPPPPQSMPWVSGLAVTAASDVETPDAGRRLAAILGGEVRGAMSVPASFGTILASYEQGVAVVDAHDHLIARAPAFAFEGSADDLVAIATGDAQLDKPVILLAITRGGHRESTTSLIVYQLAEDTRLDELFEGPIEERDGDETTSGTVTFVPHGLLYRSPHGSVHPWSFDPVRRKYVRAEHPM